MYGLGAGRENAEEALTQPASAPPTKEQSLRCRCNRQRRRVHQHVVVHRHMRWNEADEVFLYTVSRLGVEPYDVPVPVLLT